MDSYIKLENVNLKFKIYLDKGLGIKEFLISSITKNKNRIQVKEFLALNNININITNGERVGIIGNNGAGKSTLLKLISNIYYPTSGKVSINGKVAPLIELGAGFNPELTGRENIYLNGAILGYSKEELKDIEHEIVDFSELNDFIDVPIKYYSTGMYGRLAFTMATQIMPEILLIDEIFAGGDINFIDKALQRMYNLINSSQVFITVSHSMDLIKQMCNRVIVLNKGLVVFDGEVDDGIKYYMENCKSTN